MKTFAAPKILVAIVLAAVVASFRAHAADNVVDSIELLRTAYKGDRQLLVAQTLQLTENESASFWPMYRSYRADMDKLGDGLLKLVLEYADVYPNVPEERARQLLKDYLAAEEKLAKKRGWYVHRASKFLPANKALRWAQLENRMDLVLRLQIASSVPLMPGAAAKP